MGCRPVEITLHLNDEQIAVLERIAAQWSEDLGTCTWQEALVGIAQSAVNHRIATDYAGVA